MEPDGGRCRDGRTTAFSDIESLIGGNAADTFGVLAAGSLSGLLDGGLDKATALGVPATDSLDYSTYGSTVSVDLALAIATAIASLSRIDAFRGSSLSGDTLTGPGVAEDHINWTIDGPNSGDVEGTIFSGFENLTGRGAASDYFLFDASGTLSGLLDGGTGVGATDGFAVSDGTTTLVFGAGGTGTYTPLVADVPGWARPGWTVHYANMDSGTVLEGDDANRVIKGTVFNDDIVLEAAAAGHLKVTFNGFSFYNGAGIDHSLTFVNPSESLKISGGSGGDTITVKSLDPGFAADLLLYGNKSGAPTIEPDAGQDDVRFQGDTSPAAGTSRCSPTRSHRSGVTCRPSPTRPTSTTGDDIVFRARRIGTPEIENLLPSGYLAKKTQIDIGADATLRASDLPDRAGRGPCARRDPRPHDARSAVLPRPGGELPPGPRRASGQGARQGLRSKGHDRHRRDTAGRRRGRRSTRPPVADASAQAKSQLFSVGYSQADATATIEIQDGVLIEGAAGSTSPPTRARRPPCRPRHPRRAGKRSGQEVSGLRRLGRRVMGQADLHDHGRRDRRHPRRPDGQHPRARRDGVRGRSRVGLFADGSAALALALQFSTADILTRIDGQGHRRHEHARRRGREVRVRPDGRRRGLHERPDDHAELARTATPSRSSARCRSLESRRSWPACPRNVFGYIGPDVVGPGRLSCRARTTATPPSGEVTSEPWGYVDYANDRITVYNTDNEAATGSSSPRTRSTTRRAAAPASAGSTPGDVRHHRRSKTTRPRPSTRAATSSSARTEQRRHRRAPGGSRRGLAPALPTLRRST